MRRYEAVINEVEYLAQRYEVNIHEYEKLLLQLGISGEGKAGKAPIAAAPESEVLAQRLPTIIYRKESLSENPERDPVLAKFWGRYKEAETDEEYYERR